MYGTQKGPESMDGAAEEGYALAIASGKGGVGKTTTAVNLGAAFVESGYTVAVVDFDLGMANLGAMVGLTQPNATIHDVLGGRAALDAALHEAGGLTIAPGSTVLDHFADAETDPIEGIVTELKQRFDLVILDAGAGLSHDIAITLQAADGVLLVTTAELPALTDASKTGELVDRLAVPVVGAVFTGTGEGSFDDVEGVATALGTTGAVTVSIPADQHVKESVRKGMPVVFDAESAPATVAYKRLAKTLKNDLGFDENAPDSEAGFEWVDPESGNTVSDDTQPGPVMEVPLETLIEEAGLNESPAAMGSGERMLNQVRSWFGG
jgi:septum site-determining protein MinD